MRPLKAHNTSDDYNTPRWAVNPLIPYLKGTIWECACGKGYLSGQLKEKGFKVIATDIKTGKDFLKWQPKKYDMIVTNPPYSIKNEFIERAYKLDKPFALLLPLNTLETPTRQKMFKKYGIQVLIPDRRISFYMPKNHATIKSDGSIILSPMTSQPHQVTAWFCYKMNLPKDINFITF